MATLRTQLCTSRQALYFDPEVNPRAVSCVLYVGNPQSEVTTYAVITERLGKSHHDESTGVDAVSNAGSVLVNRAEVPDIPEIQEGFRGTCTDPDGVVWQLGDIQFRDDAVIRVKAIRTVVTGASHHRAQPWGG